MGAHVFDLGVTMALEVELKQSITSSTSAILRALKFKHFPLVAWQPSQRAKNVLY